MKKFCWWTIFEFAITLLFGMCLPMYPFFNIRLNLLTWNSLESNPYPQMELIAGVFHGLQLTALAEVAVVH